MVEKSVGKPPQGRPRGRPRRYINDLPPAPTNGPRIAHLDEKKIAEATIAIARLPEDDRPSAIIKSLNPSNLKTALYHFAKGASPAEACEIAGAHPRSFELYLKSNDIGHDLRRVMQGVLEVDYAPAALRFLNSTVHDPAMPARVRVDAARIIVDRAGYVAAPPASDEARKDLQDMSLAELEAQIHWLEDSLKNVTPAAEDASEGGDNDGAALAPPSGAA
jgi:hypothetical protein